MSDPRMIPADEARAMRELLPGDLDLAEYDMFDRMAKWLPYYKTYAAAPDLAHTVVEQAARIEQLETVLDAVAPHSLAQGGKLRRQAAQIERVREAVSRIEKKLENGTTEWREGLKANQYLEGYTDGLDVALAEIEQALGDTDD